LLVDCERNPFTQALRARIESADDALQLGKFLDEFGGEIGLGKARSKLQSIEICFRWV